jgi:hypothetical protein
LAVEIREIRSTVETLVAETTETRTILIGTQKTLLGNGQPGRCSVHTDRIDKLERWQSWVTGGLAIAGLLWGAITAIIATLIAERMKRP